MIVEEDRVIEEIDTADLEGIHDDNKVEDHHPEELAVDKVAVDPEISLPRDLNENKINGQLSCNYFSSETNLMITHAPTCASNE